MKNRFFPVALIFVLVCLGLSGCASPQPERTFYAALGASDAFGIGAFPLKKGYVFRIEDRLEESRDVDLLLLAVPGADVDTIREILEFNLRIGIQPNLVTLWTGANDIIAGDDPEEFEADLKSILEQLRDKTPAVIVMADIPDLTKLPRFVDNPSRVVTTARIEAFNSVINSLADEFDVPVAKLSELEISDELASDIDGFHPSNEGHKMVAEAFLNIILPELGISN